MRSTLLSAHGLIHGFSQTADGNIDFRYGPAPEVTANHAAFLRSLEIDPAEGVMMRVEGKDSIAVVDADAKGRGMRSLDDAVVADGLVTSARRVCLLLAVADCLPIILFDPAGRLALVHAGWKGTDLRIVQKAVRLLKERFGVRPDGLVAHIGPGIGAASYRFRDPIQRQLPDWAPYLEDLASGETAIDLAGFNRQQLVEAGVPAGNIETSDVDTASDPNYFSHYRVERSGETEGRFMAAVMLP